MKRIAAIITEMFCFQITAFPPEKKDDNPDELFSGKPCFSNQKNIM